MKKKLTGFILGLLLYNGTVYAQIEPVVDTIGPAARDPYSASVEVRAGYTGDRVPYWMRSLQYGSIPLEGASLSAIAAYKKEAVRKIDLGVGFEARGNIGNRTEAILIEGYAKVKFFMVELSAGRMKEVYGLMDTLLGSGSLTISGNALGIPKINLAVPDFSFPLFKGWLSFKGNYAQGFLGQTPFRVGEPIPDMDTYAHQKSLYVRIGPPTARVRGYAGVNHQATWAYARRLLNNTYNRTPFQTYMHMVFVPTHTVRKDQSDSSKIDNHVSTGELGLEIRGKKLDGFIYRQQLYDVSPFFGTGTFFDGLYGISIRNTTRRQQNFRFERLTLEYISTVRMADRVNIYNHEYLINGHSYGRLGIGHPLITTKYDIREPVGMDNPSDNFFQNNRIAAVHAGMEATVYDLLLRTRISNSWNGGFFGRRIEPLRHQLSLSIEGIYSFHKDWRASALFALDSGGLLPNTAGGYLSLARVF